MQRTTELIIQPQDTSPDRTLAARRPHPLHQRAQNEAHSVAAVVETTLRFVQEMCGRSPPAA